MLNRRVALLGGLVACGGSAYFVSAVLQGGVKASPIEIALPPVVDKVWRVWNDIELSRRLDGIDASVRELQRQITAIGLGQAQITEKLDELKDIVEAQPIRTLIAGVYGCWDNYLTALRKQTLPDSNYRDPNYDLKREVEYVYREFLNIRAPLMNISNGLKPSVAIALDSAKRLEWQMMIKLEKTQPEFHAITDLYSAWANRALGQDGLPAEQRKVKAKVDRLKAAVGQAGVSFIDAPNFDAGGRIRAWCAQHRTRDTWSIFSWFAKQMTRSYVGEVVTLSPRTIYKAYAAQRITLNRDAESRQVSYSSAAWDAEFGQFFPRAPFHSCFAIDADNTGDSVKLLSKSAYVAERRSAMSSFIAAVQQCNNAITEAGWTDYAVDVVRSRLLSISS